MDNCNIDLRALGMMFRKMKHEHGQHSEMDFFTTHPHMNSRIKKSFEYPVKADAEFKKFDLDWESVREACKTSVE